MFPSRRLASAPSRAHLFVLSLALSAVVLVGMLALSALGSTVAHADAQPTITVSVKSGADTQTTYTVVAANFPANSTLTETFGDGSNIPPTTGQSDANGSMTRYWTLDVDNIYCGSISASTGSAQATASFWVAPTSDSRSGTPCDGGGGVATTPTPDTTATAAAQATDAATQAPTQAPITQPTAVPASSGSGSSGQGILSGRLLLLIAGIAVGLVILIVVGFALAAVLRKPDQRTGGWGASSSGRQPAQGWRQVPPGGPYGQPYGQSYSPGAAPRHESPQGWPQQVPQQAPRTPNRIPNHVQGAGEPDPRWRLYGDQGRDEEGTPDPRWSRSQPGARGGRGPAGSNSGSNSAGRIRTLRDFTEQHQSVRPPGRDDRGR
jgi:hypothetical protein